MYQRKALKQGMLLFYSGRDGIPPYRLRKQHRREMQESAKANGRVPLPHIPVSSTVSFPRGKYVKYVRFLVYSCSAFSSLTPLSPVFIWGCFKMNVDHTKKEFGSFLPNSSSRAAPKCVIFLNCSVSSQLFLLEKESTGWHLPASRLHALG